MFQNRVILTGIATLRDANDQVRGVSSASARVVCCLGRIVRQNEALDGTKLQEFAELIGCSCETISVKLVTLNRKKHVYQDKHTMRFDMEGVQRYLRDELRTPRSWA